MRLWSLAKELSLIVSEHLESLPLDNLVASATGVEGNQATCAHLHADTLPIGASS
jgi:hypothetical protein